MLENSYHMEQSATLLDFGHSTVFIEQPTMLVG